MKLIYVAGIRLPTEKAHGLGTMKLCEAFTFQKIEVELIYSWRFRSSKQDPFDYYKVLRNFKTKKIPSLDLIPFLPNPLGALVQHISFAIFSTLYLLFREILPSIFTHRPKPVFFSRDHLSLFFLSFFSKNIYYDVHQLLSSDRYYRWILPRFTGLTVTNKLMREELMRKFSLSGKKIFYAPNGTDLKQFEVTWDKKKCRQKLSLPIDKKIVLYTGHLYPWKGANVLTEASQYLSKDTEVHFVGGIEKVPLLFETAKRRLRILFKQKA